MGLLDILRNSLTQGQKAPTFEVTGTPDFYYKTLTVDSKDYLDNYLLYTYRAVKVKAEAGSSYAPTLVTDTDTAVEISPKKNQLLSDLMRFNPYMSFNDARKLMFTRLSLAGCDYWAIFKSEDPKHKVEFYPLNPEQVRVQTNRFGLPETYYFRDTMGVDHAINHEDIIVFKNPHPRDWVKNTSDLEASRYAHNALELSFKYNMNMFQNMGTPNGYMVFEGAGDDEKDRVEAKLREKYSGWKNAGRIGVLNRVFQWIPTGATQKEMDFVEGSKFMRDTILSIQGVPKTLVGIEDSSYANAEQALRVFQRFTLQPMLDSEVSVYNEQLIPKVTKFMTNKQSVIFEAQDCIDIDAKAQAEEAGLLYEKKLLTLNEARAIVGYPDIKGGDEIAKPEPKAEPKPEPEEPDIEKLLREETSEEKQIKAFQGLEREEKKLFYYQKAIKNEETMKSVINSFLDGQAKRLVEETKKVTMRSKVNWNEEEEILILTVTPTTKRIAADYADVAEMEIGKRSKALSSDVLGQLESNIAQFFGEINDTTKKHFQELLARSIEDSLSLEDTKEAITRLFNGYIEGVDNIKVLEEMGVYSPRIVVDNGNAVVTPTSRYNQMYNSIMLADNKEEGLKALYGVIDPLDSEGAGVLQKIRDQIEVSNITFARSETIARTEVGRIAGFIQRKTYFSSEFVKRLEWLSAHDKFTRTEPEGGHLAADGQTREKGIKFSVGGEWLEYPGDPEGSAENTINCRCTLLPILE